MKTTTNETLIIESLHHEPIDTSFYPMVSAFQDEDVLYVCVCLLLTHEQKKSLDVNEVIYDPIIINTFHFDRHFNITVDDENGETKHPYAFTFNIKDIIPTHVVYVSVTTPSDPIDYDDDMNADPKTKRGTEVTVQSSTHLK